MGAVPIRAHAANLLRHLTVAVRVLAAARRHQAIYVQKVILPRWFFRAMKRGGGRVVFDYDDAMYALAPGEEAGPRAFYRRRRVRRFTACLESADLVVVENEPNRLEAEKYCARTLTITGPIDTDRYRPRWAGPKSCATTEAGLKSCATSGATCGATNDANSRVVLGWIGSPSTTGYLRLLEPALARLARDHRIALHLIGAAAFDVPGVTVRHFPWALETEVGHLGTFDIGLMPLTDDPWSRGKGGYKILQYMAMGIPTVASPVGVNADLVRHGETGLLAATIVEWVQALERLVRDGHERDRMGRAAREDAEKRFSLEHYAPMFIDALLTSAKTDGPPEGGHHFGSEGARP
jgi:glycosyltransferase involved in cell wall biosynthesis